MIRKQERADKGMSDSNRSIYVGIGELAIGYSGDFLKISSLGSCIGLVIYHKTEKISEHCAVMGHIMLHSNHNRINKNTPSKIGTDAKYADKAVPTMISKLEKLKLNKDKFVAKMAGGAKMFGKSFNSFDIGKENSRVIKSLLVKYDIPLIKHFTGGNTGMRVIFNVNNYSLSVTPTGGKLIQL